MFNKCHISNTIDTYQSTNNVLLRQQGLKNSSLLTFSAVIFVDATAACDFCQRVHPLLVNGAGPWTLSRIKRDTYLIKWLCNSLCAFLRSFLRLDSNGIGGWHFYALDDPYGLLCTSNRVGGSSSWSINSSLLSSLYSATYHLLSQLSRKFHQKLWLKEASKSMYGLLLR